ncbi:MAG: hypothetical protein B7X11_04925 [Acidobacteria bacterium 37-65-4]|nr:MAG: hypothetical protein B7X11_04925 [Acidobacteria bacterium 37-65-4]
MKKALGLDLANLTPDLRKQHNIKGKVKGVLITAVPAILVLMFTRNVFQALIWSQVALSMQLPFTVIPLTLLTRSRKVMGEYANGRMENILLYTVSGVILFLNGLLILDFFGAKF